MEHHPQIPFKLGIIAVFMFIFINLSYSQQKIQIKDGTAPKGHFFVEILQNMPGAPMKSFSGNGGTISTDVYEKKFILRMQNFVWYNPDEKVELLFNKGQFNVNSEANVTFENKKEIILKPLSRYITDIYFNVIGEGKVKILIPFSYANGSGRFMQEFTINGDEATESSNKTQEAEEEKIITKLKTKDVKKIWKTVDTADKLAILAFIDKYKDEKVAKRYVKIANKTLVELLDNEKKIEVTSPVKTLEEKQPKKSDTKINEIKHVETKELEVSDLDSKKLETDIKTIIDSLDLGSNDTNAKANQLATLTLILNEDAPRNFKISHSEMPLQFNFHEIGEKKNVLINSIQVQSFLSDTTIHLNHQLLKQYKLKGDFSSFNLVNAQGTDIFNSMISINTNKGNKNNSLFYIIAVSLLLLAFGGFVLFNNNKKEKERQETKKVFKAKMEENLKNSSEENTTVSSHDEIPVMSSSNKTKQKIKISGKQKTEAIAPKHSISRNPSKSRIKITSRKKSGISIPYEEFAQLVNSFNTVHIDLMKIWSDSSIKNVYLTPNYIKELDRFLADSSNEGIQNELQGAIPEVGGFMMGRFSKNKGHLEVLVEKFVPFVPEYNDVFKIEIGTQTLVHELGDAQDKNPKLEVIGWFHTHPGHGLFLSTSDLSVQRHFPNDYQVAMEIDSLTKGLDMSIFTRKNNGRMNNSTDRVEGKGWFQWVEIDNFNEEKA